MKKPLILFSILLLFLFAPAQKEKYAGVSLKLKSLLQRPNKDSMDLLLSVNNPGFYRNQKSRIRVWQQHVFSGTIVARVAANEVEQLLADSTVVFADILRKAKEELTTGAFDLTLNQINLAHDAYPLIDGNDINASVKEQLLDTLDIDIKGRFFNCGLHAATASSHASIMATILAGGGNTSPYALGAAPGARVTSSSFATLLPDPDSIYANRSISVQNHSYGTGIENYYGADARAYDASVNQNPWLVHVFSAGNSGDSTSNDGSFAGIKELANITGSFKMAKNIITVGSLDSFYQVMPKSSRGPAYDGRVKPELVAYGEDGSSGAAAITSGTVALLQHSYRQANSQLPTAALIKAVLLNTAEDLAAKGPDFLSGYGSVNAFSALQTVEEHRYYESSVRSHEKKVVAIVVPPNIRSIKLTVAWSDPPATANAEKALVNDIDVLLRLPGTGESWQPWVLGSFPSADSLLLPATRKRDSLNNVEQVSVDYPAPGLYEIEIAGLSLLTASQDFALAYQLDTLHHFAWTYPTGSDVLQAAQVNTIRWQTNDSSEAMLEYSLDGARWQSMANRLDARTGYFKWQVPDTVSTALLRITQGGRRIISDSFAISRQENLNVGFNCPDSVLLYWNALPVGQYQLYMLGFRYLEPVERTNDTVKIFKKNNLPSEYVAVAPVIDKKTGKRSFTLNFARQGVGCYLRSFYVILQNGHEALLSSELGSLYGVKEIAYQKLTSSGYQTIHTLPAVGLLTQTFVDSNLVPGANFYRLQIILLNGNVIYSDPDKVYYLPHNPVLVFPNPARRNETIQIVTGDPGKYTIHVLDINGRMVRTLVIQDILQPLPSLQLGTGMYFIKIISDEGKRYQQKLIVL